MLNNLFWKTLRDQRWALLGWAIGLAGLSLYLYICLSLHQSGRGE